MSKVLIPDEYKMNYDQILNKPFPVRTIEWNTGNTSFTELGRISYPSAIFDAMNGDTLSRVPFSASTFFQARMCAMLQVSGTPMHMGLLLVAALPVGTPVIQDANQILTAPHVFLNANESTSVCLECPMYTPTSVYRTGRNVATNDVQISSSALGLNVFDLIFFVMDALATGPNSSTSVTISIHNIFKKADFYVPRNSELTWSAQAGFYSIPTTILDKTASVLKTVTGDLIDKARLIANKYTGFHNPNDSTTFNKNLVVFRNSPNAVDSKVHFEVLDNHPTFSRIVDDYIFRTQSDEMDLKFLLNKPVFCGSFSVNSNDVSGTLLAAIPITPMVEVSVNGGNVSTNFYSPMRTIYECSRHWRGSLRLHIQSVCTNFHFCKIIVLKNYANGKGMLLNTNVRPTLASVHHLNLDALEYSAGGEIQTIELPFCSQFRQLECTKDVNANAVAHGVAYIYLFQPLVFNATVPTSIQFNVYMSGGEDLEFSGYATDNFNIPNGTPPTYQFNTPFSPESFIPESGENCDDAKTLVEESCQEAILNSPAEIRENNIIAFKANKSVRDYCRFMYPQSVITFTPTKTSDILAIPLSSYFLTSATNLKRDAFTMFSSFYLGLSGGFKIKLKITGATAASAAFIPPTTFADITSSRLFQSQAPIPTDATLRTVFENSSLFVPVTKSFTFPQVEMQDYTRMYQNTLKPSHLFELEFVIPNMNTCNYTGNALKWRGLADYENDLGFIFVRYETANNGIVNSPISIEPFIGLNDESRFGFQVFSPEKRINTTSNGISIARSSLFNFKSATGVPMSGVSSSSYYFKTI